MSYLHSVPYILVGFILAQAEAVLAGRFLGLPQSLMRNAATGLVGLAGGGLLSWELTSRQPGVPGDSVVFIALTLLATMVCAISWELLWPRRSFSQRGRGSIPHPIRAVKRRIQRSRRLVGVTLIATRYGLGSFLGSHRPGSSSSTAIGRNLRLALNDAGGIFIKLGQFLSTRPDLLPAALIDELVELQDRVNPVPIDEIWQVVHEELGEGADNLFAEFNPTPIASASIAQVHRAVLRNGEVVAVKVQRPGIDVSVERDIDLMYDLANKAERRSSFVRSLRAVELVDAFAASLRQELDFRVEAQNMQAIRSAEGAEPQVVVAAVSENLVTKRVLGMEWLEGDRLPNVGGCIPNRNPNRHELAGRLLASMLRQIAFDGVFHADPHPGNVRFLADGRLALLDFGSVGRLDNAQLENLRTLLLAIRRKNAVLFTDSLLDLAYPLPAATEERVRRSLARFMADSIGAGADSAALFRRFVDIVRTCGLAFPGEIAAVFRSLALLERTLQLIEPGYDLTREVTTTEFALTNWEHIVPSGSSLSDELTSFVPIFRRLPRRMDRISAALESGSFEAGLRLGVQPSLNKRIDEVTDLVVLAFLGPGVGAVSAMLLGLPHSPELSASLSLYQLLGYAGLCVSAAILFRVIAVVLNHSRP